MHKLLALIGLFAVAKPAWSQETLRQFDWPQLQREGRLRTGTVASQPASDTGAMLKITPADPHHVDPAAGNTYPILTIEQPGITASNYALEGRVKYEGVTGTAYLMTWNYFADGGMYFSRSLADTGPLARLSGTSDWREFRLPFFIGDSNPTRPSKIDFSLVLPGGGTVYLEPIRLVQYKSAGVMGGSTGWWDDQTGGWIGGSLGGIFGCLGGLLGTLAGLGRARRFATGLMHFMLASGVLSFVVGIIALVRAQPYGVTYPFLLMGVILVLVIGGNRSRIRKQYEAHELRKMQALDA